MVYTAIYSKNVLTYVALFHNDLCFTANHCIIRPILGVSSIGLHPGWILLPNITIREIWFWSRVATNRAPRCVAAQNTPALAWSAPAHLHKYLPHPR